jgi:hypothetical protein
MVLFYLVESKLEIHFLHIDAKFIFQFFTYGCKISSSVIMVILGDEEEHLVRVSDIVMQETNCTQF